MATALRLPDRPTVDTPTPDDLTAIAAQDLGFLDWQHAEFTARVAAWARDEARQAGADAVLRELVPWKGEDAQSYAARRTQAKYLNFPQIQSLILTGHLERARPVPGKGFELGPMGPIEDAATRQGRAPSAAEMFWEGADGIGTGANPFAKVAAGEQRRACATGHRWTIVEMPALADVRRQARRPWRLGSVPDAQDEQDGFRPYLLTLSPRMVPYWKTVRGSLRALIARVPVESDDTTGEGAAGQPAPLGYYVLVAAGFEGFGPYFARGGWWLFDGKRRLVVDEGQPMAGDWADTDGEIPAFALVAGEADAALDLPRTGGVPAGAVSGAAAGEVPLQDAGAFYAALYGATFGALAQGRGAGAFDAAQVVPMSRSLTMELGQLAVNLMNRMSERDANFSTACKSIKYVLGVNPSDPAGFNLTVAKEGTGSITVPVPAWRDDKDATHVPSIWSSSAGLVDAQAAKIIVDSCLEEARELMVRQVSAQSPSQSGTAKQIDFTSGSSPLLAHMLLGRAAWEGNVVYFVCRRAGWSRTDAWRAVSRWPREVELRPVLDDIDATFTTLRAAGIDSVTLAVDLVLQMLEQRGQLPPDKKATIVAELTAAATARVTATRAQSDQAAADAALLTGDGAPAHVASGPTDTVPPPTVAAPPVDLAPLESRVEAIAASVEPLDGLPARLDALVAAVTSLAAQVTALAAERPAPPAPPSDGPRVFDITIRRPGAASADASASATA